MLPRANLFRKDILLREWLGVERHKPQHIYRGHKADLFEGGHRVPFIAKWPASIPTGLVSAEVISTNDLLATVAEITDYPLGAGEGEDSYSLLPTLMGDGDGAPARGAVVHHSVNGSFAIREGDWKLIMVPGSGGWSYPRPGRDTLALDTLPPRQLYNLRTDPGETNNLFPSYPDKVAALTSLLKTIITEGRSTPGAAQPNDPVDFVWKQVAFPED